MSPQVRKFYKIAEAFLNKVDEGEITIEDFDDMDFGALEEVLTDIITLLE